MSEWLSRTERLLGREKIERLQQAKVAVFGLGGVGGYVVEALARSGIGRLDLTDDDKICESNLNRQIIATTLTVGQYKVDVARERVLSINPDAIVHTYRTFYLPDTAGQFDFSQYDYVVDAIDTVTGKLTLVEQAMACGVPIISSMGTGNKMDPSAFQVADIAQTSVCPLAKVMRRELKKRGIYHLKVVYSKEQPEVMADDRERKSEESGQGTLEMTKLHPAKRQIPGSNAFVPAVAGLIIAGEVVQDLIQGIS